MGWIIGFALLTYALAILSLVYSFYAQGTLTLTLWGYAPNQYFFMPFPFLLATYASYSALYCATQAVRHSETASPALRFLASNWPALILAGLMLASAITIIDFFNTPKSFDKLERVYAEKAASAARAVHDSLAAVPDPAKREMKREEMIRDAIQSKNDQSEELRADPTKLRLLDNATYLQVVQDAKLQRALRLLNPTTHALVTLQLLATVLVAWCAVVAAGLCLGLNPQTGGAAQAVFVSKSVTGVYAAVVCFSVWVVCYRQMNLELQYVIGTTPSTLRLGDLFGALVILGILSWLWSIEPATKETKALLFTYIPPMLFVGAGVAVQWLRQSALRNMIGVDGQPATQLILQVIVLILILPLLVRAWPGDSEAVAARPQFKTDKRLF